jgi:hypothetical protein
MESVLALHWVAAYRAGFIHYGQLRQEFDFDELRVAAETLDAAEALMGYRASTYEVKND